MTREILINSLDKLETITHEVNFFTTGKFKVTVQFNELNETENRELEKVIQALYPSCGCKQGRITGYMTFVIYISLLITGLISWQKLGILNTVLLFFGFSFVTMLIGKLYGLLNGRRRLRSLTKQLEDKLASLPKPK